MKFIVTGFGLFGSYQENASWQAVKALPEDSKAQEILEGCEVHVEEIPVDYKFVQEQIPSKWSNHSSDFIVHVGVSSCANDIQLETRARNKGYGRTDVNATCPPNGECIASGDSVLQTSLDMPRLLDDLKNDCKDSGLSFSLSDDAGNYLCEFVYYSSLAKFNGKCLFVHVPDIDQPYGREELTEGLARVIKQINNQIKK